MGKRDLISNEVSSVRDEDLDALLACIRLLKSRQDSETAPALLAESALSKDWLTPEEEAAWADL